jgi:hypothetical protein
MLPSTLISWRAAAARVTPRQARQINTAAPKLPAIAVHGGAWNIPDKLKEASVAGVAEAARAGWACLSSGGSSLDAVEAAVRVLEAYPWPGNVRELENTLQRAAVLSTADTLLPKDIPLGTADTEATPAGAQAGETREMTKDRAVEVLFNAAVDDTSLQILPWIEREFTLRAMQKTGDNQVRAAKLLGITRATLRKRLDRNSAISDEVE